MSILYIRANLQTARHLILLLIASLLLSLVTHAQVKLAFTGTPSTRGTKGAVGSTYTYSNIGMFGTIPIRAVFELINKDGNASLNDMDVATGGTAEAWQPLINGSTAANDCWGLRFQLSFFNATTGAPVSLPKITANAIDIDGDNGNLREYVEFLSPNSYAVETPTKLTVTRNGADYNFQSPKELYTGIALTETSVIAAARYESRNSLIIELGSCCVGAACSATGITRQYSINFQDSVKFRDGMVVLPANFLSFHAEKTNTGNKITWRVSDEINVQEYILEKSHDGERFDTVTELPYAGSPGEETAYSFTDASYSSGAVYYPVKTVDIDGKDYYSHSIKLTAEAVATSLKIVGNPVEDELWFEYTSAETQQLNVEVITPSGQVIRDFRPPVEEGFNRVQYPDITSLSKGLYVLVVIDRHGRSLTQEWVKM